MPKELNILSIEDKLEKMVSFDRKEISEYSNRIFQYANQNFTLEAYTESLKRCFQELF